MKKTQGRKPRKPTSDDMSSEYRFDYDKARPNRFAERASQTPLVVLVDPDLAKVFTTAESVNHALRALIEAMPTNVKGKTAEG